MTDEDKRVLAVRALDLFTNNVLSQVKNVELAEAIYACIEQAGDDRLETLKTLVNQ